MATSKSPCVQLKCPGCKQVMETTIPEMCSSKKAACPRCGSAYEFTPQAMSSLAAALRGLELSQTKLSKALEKALDTAETGTGRA
jgi:uncharacterized paraquat-inducible protein A